MNHFSGLVENKMLTAKQLNVLDVFRRNLGKKLTAKQIKEESKINSNKFLYKALDNCKSEGLIISERVGKSLLYSLELNSRSSSYLGFIAYELYNIPKPVLLNIEREFGNKLYSFVGLVFGSYAKGKQRKDSDIDIAILVEKKEVAKAKAIMESIKLKEMISIHSYVFSYEEFIEMLKHDMENVGKEILRHHLVFYNPSVFYTLIRPWIQ